MPRVSVLVRALWVATVALVVCSFAQAQNAGDIMQLFGGMMRAAIVEHAVAEWSKIPFNELSCIDSQLQQQGLTSRQLAQNGIAPTDPRLSAIRISCRQEPHPPPRPAPVVADQSLSAKPTFDCEKVRSSPVRSSPVPLVLCADPRGAHADWYLNSAYWALLFSLDESSRSAFKEARESWESSLKQECRLLPVSDQFSSAQRGCVIAAFKRRADAYRSRLTGDALTEATLTPEDHAKIQIALAGLGLFDSKADGEFGPFTRTAIKRYQASLGATQAEFLTAQQRESLLTSAIPPHVAQASTSAQ